MRLIDRGLRAMAEGQREEQYIIEFKNGNKLMAEQLLPSIPQPATITTTFKSRILYSELISLVSLLHAPSCVLGLEECRHCASISV